MPAPEDNWIPLNTSLPVGSRSRRLLIKTVKRLISVQNTTEVRNIRSKALLLADRCHTHRQVLRVCLSVFCDLRLQGWSFRVSSSGIQGALPHTNSTSPLLEKQRIREAHLFERNSQLRLPATRQFIRRMERRRLGPNGWTSIFSLMRDGEELTARLRAHSRCLPICTRAESLRSCIDPYIQVVTPASICEFTGFKLTDVWRYFRHTWVTPYYSIPGRQLWILIRDRAAPNHPVVGIAALGSAVVQLTPRDNWIGWTPNVFVKNLQDHPTASWAKWISVSLRQLIRGVFRRDFLQEKLLSAADLRSPSQAVVQRLLTAADQARRLHGKYPKARQHKRGEHSWKNQACTYLFRSKRARVLAELLNVKQKLREAGYQSANGASLANVLQTSAGRRAIEVLLKHVKATHAGIDMLDITVCGAIPPYNPLLGGKLVAMLLASPEVSLAYERKYARASSIIASSMAGRSIIRKPNLVLLGTTSLYGVSSSQYNRITIPAQQSAGQENSQITYELVGKSLGYGSYHLSAATVAEIEPLLAQSKSGRKVNSIFGEGVNPRLRKIRDGLTEAGFPSDVLLLHGNPRLIYCVRLASNFRELLVGRTTKPRYLLHRHSPAQVTRLIVDHWMNRWLSKRITREEALSQVNSNSLHYPLNHAARVQLPPMDDEYPLFAAGEIPNSSTI